MKPDDVLLRLKNLPIKPSHSHVQIEQRDFWYLISQVETLTAEKERLVTTLKTLSGLAGDNLELEKHDKDLKTFMEPYAIRIICEEAIASVQKGAE